MNWDTVKTPIGRSADPPAPELVELCWRMKGPSDKVLQCGIYRSAAPGVEVRAGYGDDLQRSERVRRSNQAREIADTWKALVLAKGGFTELSDSIT
jgi:hypothetical protein